MAFVIIMILFDVKDYRLLYGSISLSSEKIYSIEWYLVYSGIQVFGILIIQCATHAHCLQ